MSINYVTRRYNGIKKIRKGGGLAKVHMVFRGVIQKSTMVHKREGGQKCPKIGPHGLSMTPNPRQFDCVSVDL